MQVIFRVCDEVILTVSMSADNTRIEALDAPHPRIAQAAFPALAQPTTGALLTVLRAYAGIDGNLGLSAIAEATQGAIGFIEFKQNLNILFKTEAD